VNGVPCGEFPDQGRAWLHAPVLSSPGGSRFESFSSHHWRSQCECNKEDTTDVGFCPVALAGIQEMNSGSRRDTGNHGNPVGNLIPGKSARSPTRPTLRHATLPRRSASSKGSQEGLQPSRQSGPHASKAVASASQHEIQHISKARESARTQCSQQQAPEHVFCGPETFESSIIGRGSASRAEAGPTSNWRRGRLSNTM